MVFKTQDVFIELINGASTDFIEVNIFLNNNLKKVIYLKIKDCDVVDLTNRSKCK